MRDTCRGETSLGFRGIKIHPGTLETKLFDGLSPPSRSLEHSRLKVVMEGKPALLFSRWLDFTRSLRITFVVRKKKRLRHGSCQKSVVLRKASVLFLRFESVSRVESAFPDTLISASARETFRDP